MIFFYKNIGYAFYLFMIYSFIPSEGKSRWNQMYITIKLSLDLNEHLKHCLTWYETIHHFTPS